jgi:hypothetical protein
MPLVPVTGSGFASTTTDAVAVYCFGQSTLNNTATVTIPTKTQQAIRHRARRTNNIC